MKIAGKSLSLLLAALLSFSAVHGAFGTAARAEEAGREKEDINMMDVQAESYDQPISRETFCNLIVSLFAEQQETTVDELYGRLTDHQKSEAFQDIRAEDKYISLAKKYELMEGTGSSNFTPSVAISKAEVACILRNLTKSLAPELLERRAGVEKAVIEDQVELTDWSREAVAFCVESGLLKLDQHGNFDPTATMTVAQATMLVSDVKVFLNTPVPVEKGGVPAFVWYIIVGCLVLGAAIALIVILKQRSQKRARAKEELERQQEAELNMRIAPSVVPPPQTLPPRERTQLVSYAGEEEETVYLKAGQVPRVRIVGTGAIDKVFDLYAPITIGRSKECVLQLMDSTISRRHCRISWSSTSVVLEDTGARNPIQVIRGGETLPVSKKAGLALCSGDIIRVGSLELAITIS